MTSRQGRLPLPPDLLRARAPSRLGAALYVLALAGIAFWDLGGRSIFHRDLPRFATIAREMIGSGEWLVPSQHGATYANKPILYIWLVAVTSLVPGDPTALTLRIPSALALVATGWATSVWARARTGSIAAGRVAGLIAVTTYSLHELGRVGRPDMCSTCFATIAAALIDRTLLGGGGRRPWIGIGLALGGGFLSKGPVVLLIPVALAVLPRAGSTLGERWRQVRLDLALGLGVLLSLLWLVPAGLHGGLDFVKRLVVDQVGDRVSGGGNHIEAPWYYLETFYFSWLPWSPLLAGAGLAACTRWGRAVLGSTTHLGATLFAFLVLAAVPTKEIRYAAILIPPLAVATAQFLRAWALRGRDDDAPSAGRVHLVAGGAGGIAVALGAAWPLTRWPSTAPGLVPLALLALATSAAAVRVGRSDVASREVRGRLVGLALILAACGTCAYWVVLGRYLVPRAAVENAEVARTLVPSIPTVLVGGPGADTLNPDEFYESARGAVFVRSTDELARFAGRVPLQILALASDRAAIEAHVGPTRLLLERARPAGRTLLVLVRDR